MLYNFVFFINRIYQSNFSKEDDHHSNAENKSVSIKLCFKKNNNKCNNINNHSLIVLLKD